MALSFSIEKLKKYFEIKKKNLVSLFNDSPIDTELKPIKVGEKNSILELSETELKVRGTIDAKSIAVNGDNVVTESTVIYTSGDTIVASGNVVIDAGGDIQLDAGGLDITFAVGGTNYLSWNVVDGLSLKNVGNDETANLKISGAGGQLDIWTTSASGGNIVITAKKGISLDSADGEINILNDGQAFAQMDMDTADTFKFLTTNNYDLHFTSLGTGETTFDSGGDIYLDAKDGRIHLIKNGTTWGYLDTITASHLKISATEDYDLSLITGGEGDIKLTAYGTGHIILTSAMDITLDSSDDIILEADDNITIDATDTLTFDSDGSFKMRQDGAEYSVANSAYAGMILGYRCLGHDAGRVSYTLTTAFVTLHADAFVRFIAPPSGVVEVYVQAGYLDAVSSRHVYFGLSDNATYNTLGAEHEEVVNFTDETDQQIIQNTWVISGLTAGDTYNYWFGLKVSSLVGGNSFLNYGGTGSGHYSPFIMKITALPTAIQDFAVYD